MVISYKYTALQEIISKVRKQLSHSGWADALYGILSDTEFERIFTELAALKSEGIRFVPQVQIAFKFMERCPWEKVKAVIFTDYCCNLMDYSDGIPYSNSKQAKADKILQDLLYPLTVADKTYNGSKDLSRWANQGVLMLPTTLTSEMDGKGHRNMWKPFILYIIDKINHEKGNIPWVLINKGAHKFEDCIRSPHQMKVTLGPYPIPKFTDDIYGYINRILRQYDHQEIRW